MKIAFEASVEEMSLVVMLKASGQIKSYMILSDNEIVLVGPSDVLKEDERTLEELLSRSKKE